MKSLTLVLLLIGNLTWAEPSLFQNLSIEFANGTLPAMGSFATENSQLTPGRCVESTLPNNVHPAFFVGQYSPNDPYIPFSGTLTYDKNSKATVFDDVPPSGFSLYSGYESYLRYPLILQNDRKTYLFEKRERDWVFLRVNNNILLAKIQKFQSDIELICYFFR